MRATERSLAAQSAEIDGFLDCAIHELETAAGLITIYAAQLENQLANETGMDALRVILADIRGQAELVAGLIGELVE